jgi:peptidoglycan-N-acetylglucosamine deacetylase
MLANLSLDLDNKWSYLQSAGRAEWEDYPSYLPTVIPRIIEKLNDHRLSITFFVVGRDVERESDRPAIHSLVDAGHELANHSYSHQPWLHLMKPEEIDFELRHTDRLIHQVQGRSAMGFRGPGYSDSPQVRETLLELGYQYCASPFPSIVGPLARLYYFAKTGLKSSEDRQQRDRLFGRFRDCLASNRPRLQSQNQKPLWVLPVTVMPMTRLPFHFSYLLFLAEKSTLLARFYFQTALNLCRLYRVMPSLLLHPLDFLGSDDEPDLHFFPGMKQTSSQKLARLGHLLADFQKRFEVCSISKQLSQLKR